MSAAPKLPSGMSLVTPLHVALDFDALRLRARRDMTLKGRAASLYEDILDLSVQRGYCWQTKASFAAAYGVSKRAVRAWVASLVAAGYLYEREVDGEPRLYPRAPEKPTPGTDVPPRNRSSESPKTERLGGGTNLPPGTDVPPTPGTDVPPTIDHKNSPSGSSERARARAREGLPANDLPVDGSLQDDPRDRAGPTLDAVLTQAALLGIPEDEARQFFLHFDAQDWHTGSRHPQRIRRWQSKLQQWHLNQKSYDQPARQTSTGAPRTGARRTGPARHAPRRDESAQDTFARLLGEADGPEGR